MNLINKILDKAFVIIMNCLFEGFFWIGLSGLYFAHTMSGGWLRQTAYYIGGLSSGIILLFIYISIIRFDRKYLKKILANPMSPGLIPISFFFSLSDCLKIRLFRMVIYFPKSRPGLKLYDLRELIIPEYSNSEVKKIDLILLFTGWGLFFLAGVMFLATK